MIQKQGDDGDHNFDFEPWGKDSTRALTHAFTQSLACMALTHSLALPHTQAVTWLPRPD